MLRKNKFCKRGNSRFEFQFNKLRILPNSKRSQITIFIILAMILVVAFIILFMLRRGAPAETIDEENPQAFIESCTSQAVEEALDILMPVGGDINPRGSVMFKGVNITYLCYNSNYYKPCINQRPMLIEHVEKEITSYIEPKVASCFKVLESKLGTRYDIESGEMKITTRLVPKQVSINIDKHFKITKEDKIIEFNNFKVAIVHPIYEMLEVAHDIVQSEITFCNFDILTYGVMNTNYKIDKFRNGDSDILYTIGDITTNKQFKFAVRSCALPPGF